MKKIKIFRGENTLYGIKKNGKLIYDARFSKFVAAKIAELENSANPPTDWEHTKKILKRNGLGEKQDGRKGWICHVDAGRKLKQKIGHTEGKVA